MLEGQRLAIRWDDNNLLPSLVRFEVHHLEECVRRCMDQYRVIPHDDDRILAAMWQQSPFLFVRMIGQALATWDYAGLAL